MAVLLLLLRLWAPGLCAGEAAWSFPQPSPLRVQFIRGLWHETLRVEEALAALGGAVLTESWTSGSCGSGWLGPGSQGGKGWLWYFDARSEALMGQHVLVVANTNAKTFRKAAAPVAAYVRAGGSVFFLGGRWALGRDYRDSVFAALCPVTFPGEGRWQGSDLQFRPEGVALAPGPGAGALGLDGLPWQEAPKVFWYHEVVPRPEGQVVLTGGGKPLLVLGTAGKGRVAVFAGTVMGAPGAADMPFWAWPPWPGLLAKVIDWLAQAPAAGPHGIGEAGRASIEKALEAADALEMAGEPETLAQALSRALYRGACQAHDAASARLVIGGVQATPGDITEPVVVPAAAAAAEGGKTFAKAAAALVGSGQPFKTALGLRLLGLSAAPGAAERCAAFYTSGRAVTVEKDELALDEGALLAEKMVTVEAAHAAEMAIRHGALAGLGALGSPEAAAVLAPIVARLRGEGRMEPTAWVDLLEDKHRLYQEALVAALRCGDEALAGEAVAMLLENRYLVARARTEENKPDERLERLRKAIPATLAWQQYLYRQLQRVPDPVLSAMAQAVANSTDKRITPVALALCAGRSLPAAARGALAKSPVPAVSALAR